MKATLLLLKRKSSQKKNRGGSGIIQLKKEDGICAANKDLILGLNIPDYE
ncbi:hypothetical protein [Tenacibaculum mesophilum]